LCLLELFAYVTAFHSPYKSAAWFTRSASRSNFTHPGAGSQLFGLFVREEISTFATRREILTSLFGPHCKPKALIVLKHLKTSDFPIIKRSFIVIPTTGLPKQLSAFPQDEIDFRPEFLSPSVAITKCPRIFSCAWLNAVIIHSNTSAWSP
jgi:hypothetical protein